MLQSNLIIVNIIFQNPINIVFLNFEGRIVYIWVAMISFYSDNNSNLQEE